MNDRFVFAGIYLTVLAGFLVSYSSEIFAAPSFGLAVIGLIVFGFGVFSG